MEFENNPRSFQLYPRYPRPRTEIENKALTTQTHGKCSVCGKETQFAGWTEVFRESGFCQHCGSTNRQRQIAFILRRSLEITEEDSWPSSLLIYNTEGTGSLHTQLPRPMDTSTVSTLVKVINQARSSMASAMRTYRTSPLERITSTTFFLAMFLSMSPTPTKLIRRYGAYYGIEVAISSPFLSIPTGISTRSGLICEMGNWFINTHLSTMQIHCDLKACLPTRSFLWKCCSR